MDNLHLAAYFDSNFEAWYSDHASHLQSSNKDELRFAYQVGAVLGVITRSNVETVDNTRARQPGTKFDQEMQIESQITRIDFAFNRMDNVAIDIVGWMPKEDNERHHNAVEMLQRARQELLNVREYLKEQITMLYKG